MKHSDASALSPSKAAPAAAFSRSSRSFSSAGSAGRPSSDGRLGKVGCMVDRKRKRDALLPKYAAKRKAANLLIGHDDKLSKRVSSCCYVSHCDKVQLVRREHSNGEVSSGFNGLVTCKSVWACPVCSARISADRRAEMNALLAWSRSEGHSVVMLTLTARHNRFTDLVPFLAGMKDALKRFRQSKGWRALALVGSVAATEVTHGANGWHPHLHLLLVSPAGQAGALAAVENLRSEWLRSLGKFGLSGNGAAFQVQSASAAGEYIGKFGAAEELTLGHVKQGRGASSRSPWQLLADARDGDSQAGALWIEFALAFKGRCQLVWSRGLKEKAGVNDDPSADADPVVETVVRSWGGNCDYWRSARRRLVALLDAAALGGSLDAAEFGLTDAERWRVELSSSSVIE